MKNEHKSPKRILAFNPTAKYLGIAAFKGNELIHWQIRKLREKGKKQGELLAKTKRKIQELLTDYEPEIVVIGHPTELQLKNSPFLKALLKGMRETVKGRNHLIVPLIEARKFICRDVKPTKMNTAKIIATLYCPWLYRRYEKELKKELEGQWWKRKYHTMLFDAIALGLYCYERFSRKVPSPPPKSKP